MKHGSMYYCLHRAYLLGRGVTPHGTTFLSVHFLGSMAMESLTEPESLMPMPVFYVRHVKSPYDVLFEIN